MECRWLCYNEYPLCSPNLSVLSYEHSNHDISNIKCPIFHKAGLICRLSLKKGQTLTDDIVPSGSFPLGGSAGLQAEHHHRPCQELKYIRMTQTWHLMGPRACGSKAEIHNEKVACALCWRSFQLKLLTIFHKQSPGTSSDGWQANIANDSLISLQTFSNLRYSSFYRKLPALLTGTQSKKH